MAKSIGYLDTKDAIKSHTSKTDRKQLKDINHSYNITQHSQTVYLSESGMYKLILRSKMPKTEKFSNWVTEEVLPSIRKFGVYELKKSSEKEKTKFLKQINYYEEQIKLMKNDLKKNKFPDGALVYVLDYSDEDENVDGIFRIGKSDNLKIRKTIYDTHMLHNKEVVDYELSDNPLQLENCLKSMLYDYRYKDRKDFFICKLSVIKKAFKNCLKSIKNMGQTGGGLTMIEQLHNKVIRLDKKINKCESLLEK